jgi:hypothetical protein
MREFGESAADHNILSMLREGQATAAEILGGENVSTIRGLLSRTKAAGLLKSADAIITKWNDSWNAYPQAAQYAALRQAGVAAHDASAYVVDAMDHYKKGRLDFIGSSLLMFFRPAVQGGVNLLRTLNPYSKATPEMRRRGLLTFAGMIATNIAFISFLRAMAGDDDETGVNRYDALPHATTSRAAVLFMGDGYVKLPLPFGAAQASFGMADSFLRLSNGVSDPAEAAYDAFIAFNRQIMPDAFPAYDPVKGNATAWTLQSFFPQVFRPLIDVALNKNHWGSEIESGNRTPGLRQFEKGRMGTPIFWHRLARAASPAKDMTPEAHRHIWKYYMAGPLAAFAELLDEDKMSLRARDTTRATLGFPLALMGADMLYGAEPDPAQAVYYDLGARMDARLTETGTSLTDPGTKPGGKASLVRKRMRAAGFSENDIAFQLARLEIEKAEAKDQEEFRAAYKDAPWKSDVWDRENMRREAEAMRGRRHRRQAAAVKALQGRPLSFMPGGER